LPTTIAGQTISNRLRYYLFEVRFYSIEALYYAFFVGDLLFLQNWQPRHSQPNSTKQIYKFALSIIGHPNLFSDCAHRARLFNQGVDQRKKLSAPEPRMMTPSKRSARG
jgi:hypothetical protein